MSLRVGDKVRAGNMAFSLWVRCLTRRRAILEPYPRDNCGNRPAGITRANAWPNGWTCDSISTPRRAVRRWEAGLDRRGAGGAARYRARTWFGGTTFA